MSWCSDMALAVGVWADAGDGVPRVIVERRGSALVLQARDGHTTRADAAAVVACPVQLNKWVFPLKSEGIRPCEECSMVRRSDMVVCDNCGTFWHMDCAGVRSRANKQAPWFCRYCNVLGRHVVASFGGEPGVLERLHAEMPGAWSQSHATRVNNRMAAEQESGRFQRVVNFPEEFVCLMTTIRFEQFSTVLDPHCGTGTTRRELQPWMNAKVILSDIDAAVEADDHGDALDRTYMLSLCQKYGSIDAIVTSPRFDYLDLALPVLVETARLAVLCHVPTSYLFNPPDGRQVWLNKLAEEGRLHVIVINCTSMTGWRCAWMCIFKNAHWKQLLLKQHVPTATFSIGVF